MRFIGDRSISEKDLEKYRRTESSDMKKWAGKLKNTTNKNDNISLAIVSANNHYAGFGPMTANTFRKMIGLPEAKWEYNKLSNKILSDTNYSRQLLDFTM